MNITCGIDWAEAHHDVAVMDQDGHLLGRLKIDTGVGGFGQLMALLAEHSDDPVSVPVAIETDKNLIVVALQAAGLTVHAINPRAVARYRERHGQAGKKSDPGDAAMLADVLRTDRHQHRALPEISHSGQAVKVLARQHQEAIWALHQTTSRLRSVLLEFYPQALQAFPNLKHKAASDHPGRGEHSGARHEDDLPQARGVAAPLRATQRRLAGCADTVRPQDSRAAPARAGRGRPGAHRHRPTRHHRRDAHRRGATRDST